MSDQEDANKLCVGCQLCCRGAVCGVFVKDDEKRHFPTIDFADLPQYKGRSYFNQPCPHIADQGCQIYSDRPADCERFVCKLLDKVKEGTVPISDAMDIVAELKVDVEAMKEELRSDESDTRGFRELRKAWIAEGKHLENPKQSRKLLSVLKRIDKQLFSQSQLGELRATRKHIVERLLLETPEIVTPACVV